MARGHQPTHSCFGEILKKPKAPGHFSLHRDTGKAPARDEKDRGKVMGCWSPVLVLQVTLILDCSTSQTSPFYKFCPLAL